MHFEKILVGMLCVAFVISLGGCGKDYGQYAQAVKEQNMTRQLLVTTDARERERLQRQHEIKMTELAGKLVSAAAATATPTDDMMVPLMVMMMEDKWATNTLVSTANAPKAQLYPIAPPDSIGDTIRKSTGAILGVGGIVLGITQSNNMADIATAGMVNAGTHYDVSGNRSSIGDTGTVSGDNNKVGDTTTTTTTTTNDTVESYNPITQEAPIEAETDTE